MISFNYGILLAFGIVIYIMIVDPNVNEYLILVLKMIRVNIETSILDDKITSQKSHHKLDNEMEV
jgi:hypothetical protein